MTDDDLDDLIQRADLDALVRLVDQRTDAGDWAGLRRARDRSRAAVATGRQLWPVATLAEYRLALIAPPEWAGPMIAEDAGLFTVGPLTEVIAQRHTWSELAPVLEPGPGASLVAHERALRGEHVDPATVTSLPNVLDLPYELAPWEPAYELATYHDDGVDTPAPRVPPPAPPQSLDGGDVVAVDGNDVELAVRDLVEPWTAASNGRAEVAAARGTVAEAVHALGVGRASLVELPIGEALRWLSWAGASGGAYGRRRGAALGRFGALWLVAALVGRTADWPVPLDALGEDARTLSWHWWDAGEPVTGWRLQLAVRSDVLGVAYAISARDDA